MTRSSPIQPNKKRLPLHEALKRGAIALHNHELNDMGNNERESPFKAKTGVSYGLTSKGRKQKRIYIYIVYANNEEGRKVVVREMAIATKSRIPIHVGRISGAFWVILSMSKRAYQKVVNKWSIFLKRGFTLTVCLFLLVYAALHPELKDLIMKIFETPLIPSF